MASSPESRAISYAETRLKVHEVYEQADLESRELARARSEVTVLTNNKRTLQDAMTDVEMELVSKERAASPDMSQAAFDRHIKTVVHGDPDMATLRRKMLEVQHELDQAEDSVREHDTRIRILVARMEELNGLLTFYAAVKRGGTGSP